MVKDRSKSRWGRACQRDTICSREDQLVSPQPPCCLVTHCSESQHSRKPPQRPQVATTDRGRYRAVYGILRLVGDGREGRDGRQWQRGTLIRGPVQRNGSSNPVLITAVIAVATHGRGSSQPAAYLSYGQGSSFQVPGRFEQDGRLRCSPTLRSYLDERENVLVGIWGVERCRFAVCHVYRKMEGSNGTAA